MMAYRDKIMCVFDYRVNRVTKRARLIVYPVSGAWDPVTLVMPDYGRATLDVKAAIAQTLYSVGLEVTDWGQWDDKRAVAKTLGVALPLDLKPVTITKEA
jgi:hypothetical protein